MAALNNFKLKKFVDVNKCNMRKGGCRVFKYHVSLFVEVLVKMLKLLMLVRGLGGGN